VLDSIGGCRTTTVHSRDAVWGQFPVSPLMALRAWSFIHLGPTRLGRRHVQGVFGSSTGPASILRVERCSVSSCFVFHSHGPDYLPPDLTRKYYRLPVDGRAFIAPRNDQAVIGIISQYGISAWNGERMI